MLIYASFDLRGGGGWLGLGFSQLQRFNGSASAACRLSGQSVRDGAVPIHPSQPECAATQSPGTGSGLELGVCEPEGPSSAVVLPLDDESPAVAWLLGSLTKCLRSQRP